MKSQTPKGRFHEQNDLPLISDGVLFAIFITMAAFSPPYRRKLHNLSDICKFSASIRHPPPARLSFILSPISSPFSTNSVAFEPQFSYSNWILLFFDSSFCVRLNRGNHDYKFKWSNVRCYRLISCSRAYGGLYNKPRI